MDGRCKWTHFNGQVDLQLRWAQTHLNLSGSGGREMWGGVDFDRLWGAYAGLDSRPHGAVAYAIGWREGRSPAFSTLGLGDEHTLSLALELKPIDRLIIEPTLDYIRSEDAETGDILFRQAIARARMRLQVNPRLSLRLMIQHSDTEDPLYREYAQAGEFPYYHMYLGRKWEIDPLLTYRLNPFSVFCLGSTHDYRDFNAAHPELAANRQMTERQFFMKVQCLIQV